MMSNAIKLKIACLQQTDREPRNWNYSVGSGCRKRSDRLPGEDHKINGCRKEV